MTLRFLEVEKNCCKKNFNKFLKTKSEKVTLMTKKETQLNKPNK